MPSKSQPHLTFVTFLTSNFHSVVLVHVYWHKTKRDICQVFLFQKYEGIFNYISYNADKFELLELT